MSPMPRRRATLASLAAELKVSRTTISNAYNRPDQLSDALRERVLATAKRLGYPGPDPVARSLRTRWAGAVGLMITEPLTYYRPVGADLTPHPPERSIDWKRSTAPRTGTWIPLSPSAGARGRWPKRRRTIHGVGRLSRFPVGSLSLPRRIPLSGRPCERSRCPAVRDRG